MTTLLMFSGGIDSTAALVKLLKESDEPVVAHHIYKYDAESEHHADAEALAVEKIHAYCQEHYRPYTVTSSKWEFKLPYYGWNLTLCAFVGAQVCRSFRNEIKRYAVGMHLDDIFRQTGQVEEGLGDGARRVQEALGVFYASFGTAQRETLPSIHWPLREMTRQMVVDSLPAELLAMTWSCRKPLKISDVEYDTCGSCVSCLALQNIERLHRSFD